jgi:regulator of sigma D
LYILNKLIWEEKIMDKKEILSKVKEVMEAPSCCAELKAVCQEYLNAVDTSKQTEAAKKLVAELEADVQTIDAVLTLFSSETGEKIFGAETAKQLAETARKVKAEGGKYCFCPACTAGKIVLDNKELL